MVTASLLDNRQDTFIECCVRYDMTIKSGYKTYNSSILWVFFHNGCTGIPVIKWFEVMKISSK